MWNDPSSGTRNGGQEQHAGYSGPVGVQQTAQNYTNHVPASSAQTSPSYVSPSTYNTSSSSLEPSYSLSPAYTPQASAQQPPQYSQAARAEDPRSSFQHTASLSVSPRGSNYAPQTFPQAGFEPAAVPVSVISTAPPASTQPHQFHREHDQNDDRRSNRFNDRGRSERNRSSDRSGGRGGKGYHGDKFSNSRRDNKFHQHDHGSNGSNGSGGHQDDRRDSGPRFSNSAPFSSKSSNSSHLPDLGVPHYNGDFGPASNDYVPLFRPYPINTPSMDVCEITHRYEKVSVPLDISRVVKTWTNSIPLGPESLEHPPIYLNTVMPVMVNSSPVAPPHSLHPPPSTGTRIEVRLLLISGAPIDISAPKTGRQHHSNDKISFLMFERINREERQLYLPGGAFDSLLDSVSGRPSPQISDEELIRAATRLSREQLSLDLSPCTKWYRFLEFEYSATSASIDNRVIYVIPSVWELLSAPPSYEAWCAWKSTELRVPLYNDITRLRHHLSTILPHSAAYEDLTRRLKDMEAQVNAPLELPPGLATPPDSPVLLLSTHSSVPYSGKLVMCTLTHLLQLEGSTNAELAMVARGFDEYLQQFYGTSIYVHLALMLDRLLKNDRPLQFGSVLLSARKRPRSKQTPAVPRTVSPNDQPLPTKTEPEPSAKRPVKVEVKAENGEPHPIRPDAPSIAAVEAQLSPSPTNASQANDPHHQSATHPQPPVEPVLSVPPTPGRAPPKMPQQRDYRLMQAFRYFDLNRLGFLRGEDCERLLLTLGLGLTRATALNLTAAGSVNLSHSPTIASGYNPNDPMRYKPVCDWLRGGDYIMPS